MQTIRNIFYIAIRGTVGLTESRSALLQTAPAIEELTTFSVLLDVRMVESPLSYSHIVALVMDLGNYLTTLHLKIAVLYREDRRGKACGFMELYAGNRGYRIRTFTTCDQALQWLGGRAPTGAPDVG